MVKDLLEYCNLNLELYSTIVMTYAQRKMLLQREQTKGVINNKEQEMKLRNLLDPFINEEKY